MSYPPTDQQQAAIDAFRRGEHIALEAGAGTGKTSTLKFLAAQVPMHQGLYMAYNSSIAKEASASFPRNVLCKTGHGHTMRGISDIERSRLFDMPKQSGPVQARILGIPAGAHRITDDVVYANRQVARVAMETVTRFARSADLELAAKHVPQQTRLEAPDAHKALCDLVVPYAKKAWSDIMDRGGQLRWEHDYYRKRFQLEDRELPGRFLFLDEAQDSNGVTVALVRREQQRGKIVVAVGDRQQAINGWMGAFDAMDRFDGTRLALTQSFRFGPPIADEANKWLQLLDSNLRIQGFEPAGSALGDLTGCVPDAILCRKNATAVAEAMKLQGKGVRVALLKNVVTKMQGLAKAAQQLKESGNTDHPELCAFESWGQVQEYVEQDHGGSDLAVFVDLVDEHGADTILAAMRALVPEQSAQVTLSTVHTSKGREWDRVRIAGDFKEPESDEFGHQPLPTEEDMMLAYVAVTRAKKVLDRGGLAWVDQYLGHEQGRAGHRRALRNDAPADGLALFREARRAGHAPTAHELATADR